MVKQNTAQISFDNAPSSRPDNRRRYSIIRWTLQLTTNLELSSAEFLAKPQPRVYHSFHVALQATTKVAEHRGAARQHNVLTTHTHHFITQQQLADKVPLEILDLK